MAQKSIVLLGAGASKASYFSLPTMKGFFDVDATPDNLTRFLKWFCEGLPPEEYDLEEIFSFLDMSVTRLPAWTGHPSAVDMIRQNYPLGDLLLYVQRRLQIPDDESCTKHLALFDSLTPQDTILTLNYDLVADQSLAAIEKAPDGKFPRFSRMDKLSALVGKPEFMAGEPPSLLPEEQETGFFLKLHGSLDWLYCPNRECPNGSRFFALSAEHLKAGQGVGKPCRRCGSALSAFIVPPVSSKHRVLEGRLGFIWSQALRELQAATRVIVVGVSMAPSDFELRWLIHMGNMARMNASTLILINPCSQDRDAARRLFGPQWELTCFDTLEDYFAGKEVSC
jgi:hypothetical protein